MAFFKPTPPPEEEQERIIERCEEVLGIKKEIHRAGKIEKGILITATQGPAHLWLSASIVCENIESARRLFSLLEVEKKDIEKVQIRDKVDVIVHFTRKFVRRHYGKLPLTDWNERIRKISHSDDVFPIYKYLYELITVDLEAEDIAPEASE